MPHTSRSRGVRIATVGPLSLEEIGRWLDDCQRAQIPRDYCPDGARELIARFDFADDDPAADALTEQIPALPSQIDSVRRLRDAAPALPSTPTFQSLRDASGPVLP